MRSSRSATWHDAGPRPLSGTSATPAAGLAWPPARHPQRQETKDGGGERLGMHAVEALTHQGKRAEDGSGVELTDYQLAPSVGKAVDLHRSDLEQVEDRATIYGCEQHPARDR